MCGSQLSEEVKSSPVAASFELTLVWISRGWCHDLGKGPDDVQSQAWFPQRPVKHQNNLLSNCACVCERGGEGGRGCFEGTHGTVPLSQGSYMIPTSNKKYLHCRLGPVCSFFCLYMLTLCYSDLSGYECCNIPLGLEQSVPYVDGVSCISVVFIFCFFPPLPASISNTWFLI